MATALRCHALLHLAPVGTVPMLRGRHLAWPFREHSHSTSEKPYLRVSTYSLNSYQLGEPTQQYLWGNKKMVTTHLFPSLCSISHICAKLLSSSMIAISNRSAMLLHITRISASLIWPWKGGWMEVVMGESNSELGIDGNINTRLCSCLMPLHGIQASGNCCLSMRF